MTTAQVSIPHLSISADLPFTDALAQQILGEHPQALPDLSQIHILLPNAQAITQMRLSLGKQANQAFLSGFIGSLGQWINQYIEPPAHAKKQISHATRQLLLLEALKLHPDLFSTDNHWQICDSLLELFDELSLSQHQWLNDTTPVWIEHLSHAYQAEQSVAHLNQEARIIQTLWQAWQQQLDAMQISDEASTLKHRLQSDIPQSIKDYHIYIVGMEQLSPLEQAWCEQLSSIATVKWITQGDIPEKPARLAEVKNTGQDKASLLNDIYTQSFSFHERTKRYATENANLEDFFLNKIKLFDAQSAEQETQAVDLKIRLSLLAGKNNIAVVTENRKLARRLRALLERADVKIQDTAGWALATTSAATILERWLECIEQDFAYQALLDLLKSPFFCLAENYDEHLSLVYRLEQDIILHENIANDLERYKSAIKNRRDRLNLNISSSAEQLLTLINKIESAASPLTELFNNQQNTTPDIWIKTFINSIEELGLYQQLSNDIAGMRVQQELEKLSHSHSTASPEMDWQDFRTWLGSMLEREQFKPHNQSSAVKIMNMQQAQYCQFDTLIIAGANIKSLPGSPSQLPFFNQSVRQALQLKNWHQQKNYSFYQFQQLLLSADDILITWQAEKNGEWMQASPWVSSLLDFSQHAFQQSLYDEKLGYLTSKIKPVTARNDTLMNQLQAVTQAKPTLNPELIPTEFSASRHQRLIDCPYKFFAADTLKLKPLEQISQELMKREYGEKVHLILQAFHQQCDKLPAPFKHALTEQNKIQALTHIENLSVLVFETHTEDSIQHRGWLARWIQTAEAYIDWQIQRQQEWDIFQLEQKAESMPEKDIKLVGRLDRVDKQNHGFSIIDYKTGNTSSQQDIDSAENIQLTSYALLMDDICNVIYLKLDKGEARQTGIVEGESLDSLKTDTLHRLQAIVTDIKSATPLPAWGDAKTCSFCDMQGLCRKQIWEVNDISHEDN